MRFAARPRASGGRELALLGIVVAVGAVFAFTNATFLTPGNLENVAVQSSMLTLIALGMTVVIVSGGIDLSVGSTAAVAGVVAAGLSASHGWSPVSASLAGLLAGVGIGAVNGALVTVMRVPDFIATLGTLTALRGLAFVLAGGFAIRTEDAGLTWLARAEPAGVPLPILATLAVYAALLLVLGQTPVGRAFYAVGGGRATARREGLRVGQTTCLAYVLCAALAAVAGLVLAARNAAGSPQAATGWELQAVAIVILGGANLFGGRGGVTGTLLAGLLLGMINNWLSLQGYESWLGSVVLGVLLIAVVALNERDRRRRARAAAMARLHGSYRPAPKAAT